MAMRAPRICACGCGGETNGNTYIQGHQSSDYRKRDRQKDRLPTWSKRWVEFTVYLKSLGNVFCQSVDARGYRCDQRVWGFHHILPATQYDQFATCAQNVVGVCLACHNAVEANPERSRFVPTLWRAPMSDESLPLILVGSGEKVPPSVVLWSPANRRQLLLPDGAI